jgi:hypothetical protein
MKESSHITFTEINPISSSEKHCPKIKLNNNSNMTKQQLQKIVRLNQLSAEIGQWAEVNFDFAAPDIGVLEEIGELSKCFLKRGQKIRGFDDFGFFKAQALDAIGDISIYNLHVFYVSGLKVTALPEFYDYELSLNSMADIKSLLSHFAGCSSCMLSDIDLYVNDPTHDSILGLCDHASKMFDMDVVSVTEKVWTEIVSKRNWKKHPSSGNAN